MEVVDTVDSLHSRLCEWRNASERIVLVPTMGNLHDGHIKLVDEAVQCGQRVVVSIFVNPAQFDEGDDFSVYPRTVEEDIRRLQDRPVDLLFSPMTEEVYPNHSSTTTVTVPELSDILCGEVRPGHFSGVATIVLKLFNMVRPDVAVFGEKDFQQLMVIRKMVADLNVPILIKSVKTIREADGLAMSSRNRYLSEQERQRAPNLYRLLCEAARQVVAGGIDFDDLEHRYRLKLQECGFKPDYFSVRELVGLKPARSVDPKLVILAAAWLGKARLIDNKVVSYR